MIGALLLAAMAVPSDPPCYDAISVSGDTVVADIVRVRASERGVGEPGPKARILEVRVTKDDRLVGDDAVIVCKGGRATVRGLRRRAFVQGIGVLLRQMTWRNGTFSLPDGEWSFRPKSSLRQAYFARQCHNVYYMWDDLQLARYCEDLMLRGFNSVHVNSLPMLNFRTQWGQSHLTPEVRLTNNATGTRTSSKTRLG